MARSTLEILTEFETELAANKTAGIEDFFASLNSTERSSELIADLARTELYLMNWPSKRLREILEFAHHEDPLGTAYATILEGVYSDRVECGEKPSLTDFHGLDLTKVRFQTSRDPLGLGDCCGQYHVKGRIGSGAFGVVYEATSPKGDSVAIKSSYRTKNEKTATLVNELLRAEAEAAKRLQGPFSGACSGSLVGTRRSGGQKKLHPSHR